MISKFSEQVNERVTFTTLPEEGKKNMPNNYKNIQAAIDKASRLLYSGKKLGGKEFLTEIAMAETYLGTYKGTVRKTAGRGVFQLDKIGFEETKNIKSHPGLKKYHATLKKNGIDWAKVKIDDTNKLVYGAIAARLLLLIIPEAIPTTRTARARQWKKYYNTSAGKGTPQKYIDRVEYCYKLLNIDPKTLKPITNID